MLAKYTPIYTHVVNELGICGYAPNIPSNILGIDDEHLRALRACIRSVDVGRYDMDTANRTLTRLICSMLPPRGMRYARPSSKEYYRGFFIVSDVCLCVDDIYIKGMRVLRMRGGLCLQSVMHYHYVITVEYSIQTSSIHILHGKCNISGIESSSDRCMRYIRAQLVGSMYEYCCVGYECDEYEKIVGDSRTCGGSFTATLPREHDLYVVYSDDGKYDIDAMHSVWYMMYMGSLTNTNGYRNEYCIKCVIKNSGDDSGCIEYVKSSSVLCCCRVLVISRV